MTPTDAVRTMLSSLDHLAPNAELAQLTRTVTQATRARRTELWLISDDHLLRVAAYPETGNGAVGISRSELDDQSPGDVDPDGHLDIPIVFQGRALGRLRAELPTGRDLGAVESALVEDLAAHAGVVAHNAVLNGELARHVAVLEEQLDELRASRRRLVAAQDAERRKLERDLHDGAQQSLVAALIGLRTVAATSASPAAQRAEVAEVTDLLTGTSTTLTELVSDQGPRLLAERGLLAALTAAAAVAIRSGPQVHVTGTVNPELPDEVVAAVYFCCLEAIQNATKHAAASDITVAVSQTDDLLSFEISDNGAGFDLSAAPKGSGLSNLVRRLSVIGGDVSLESAPGSGTTVRGRLPLVDALDPV
jgi:signal transduction histidine kinase